MAVNMKIWTTMAAYLLLATTSVAANVDDVANLIQAGKFEDAFSSLKAAPQPTPRQSALLCYLYTKGYVAYDVADAKASCAVAVSARDPVGLYVSGMAQMLADPPGGFARDEQLALGNMADAVKLDYFPAYDWMCRYYYEKNNYSDASPFCKVAAVNHRPASAYYLGLMLYGGNGAVQDFKKARQFTLASAQMNYAPAYKLLGDLSREGKWDTHKDLTQAYAWYALASSAAPDWQDPLHLRDGLDLTPAAISAAQKLAAGWATQPAPGML